MKNVRIVYEKFGRMRFVSHLDMNRFMSRMIHKTKLPVWYTEGFNKHPYITFALPLSLGFESKYEIMDFRIMDDDLPLDDIKEALNSVFPPYLKIVDIFEPKMKTGDISYADFEIVFDCDDEKLFEYIKNFLSKKEIIVLKKSKKGAISQIDIAPKIKSYKVDIGDEITLCLTLPAGGKDNVNPSILLSVIEKDCKLGEYTICRTAIYNSEMELFR